MYKWCILFIYYFMIIISLPLSLFFQFNFLFSFPFRFWFHIVDCNHTHTQIDAVSWHSRRRLMCRLNTFGYRFLIAIKHDDRIYCFSTPQRTCATLCVAFGARARVTLSDAFRAGGWNFRISACTDNNWAYMHNHNNRNHKCNYHYLPWNT